MLRKILALGAVVALAACSSNSGPIASSDEASLLEGFSRLNADYTKKFESAGNEGELKSLADSIGMYFESFQLQYPESKEMENVVFDVAVVNMKQNNSEKALNLFQQIENTTPESQLVPKALYYKAFTYQSVVKDTALAIATYKHLYKTYPDSKWQTNARSQVLHLNNPSGITE